MLAASETNASSTRPAAPAAPAAAAPATVDHHVGGGLLEALAGIFKVGGQGGGEVCVGVEALEQGAPSEAAAALSR